ncbi:hypothetical protein AWE26_00220 [Escherichia coli]|nr:hypothetical protein [Escherichia coli]PDO33406.1 hypothetical protein AWE26_00220 [Escherichia coli]PDO50846.1 hypothetical protein AWE27_02495 [Escherichia coli]PDO52651.1 hypothetical protein AWE29_18215 [Escherichia coli]PDO68083.1 hypothetical protein AWE28_13495 [Escherichia coli]
MDSHKRNVMSCAVLPPLPSRVRAEVRVNVRTSAGCSPHPNPLPKGARGRIVRFVEFVITPLTLLITGS